jgi:Heterokaryon incompatibility protein (HET)
MIGWKKIVGCCQLALDEGLEWAWIDSCCIDKTSSSELSEAINSMFRWYRDAEICYAYLSDVSVPLEEVTNMDAFRFSKWFTRGWTLQELLAPEELKFFDKDWVYIGTKEELFETISSVTGLDICSISKTRVWPRR